MPDKNLAIITLAAGLGTRMHSPLPKCLHKIAHRPMVLHVLDTAKELEPQKLICITGPDQKALEDIVNEAGAQSIIQKERLGTAHAVLQASDELKDFDGIVLVTYGDTPMISSESLSALVEAVAQNNDIIASVLGFYTDDPGSYGRLILNDDDELIRIVEAKEASPNELLVNFVNSGFMALKSPECWDILAEVSNNNNSGEYYLTDMVCVAVMQGHKAVAVEGYAEELMGVNTKVELAHLEELTQEQLREYHMLAGVTLLSPTSTFFAYDTQIGEGCRIEPNVFFGEGVQIGKSCHIKANSHIEGATVGNHCQIGPFARLRPEAVIGDNCHIGNFVEVKKSTIANGAKINHLTYIGDATIGERTNVGAGTITCNYDGFFKYPTQIGADVFIGSNTSFVAPVTVGDGSTTAAGSVITSDVAAESLAITRAERRDIANWSTNFRKKQKAKKEN